MQSTSLKEVDVWSNLWGILSFRKITRLLYNKKNLYDNVKGYDAYIYLKAYCTSTLSPWNDALETLCFLVLSFWFSFRCTLHTCAHNLSIPWNVLTISYNPYNIKYNFLLFLFLLIKLITNLSTEIDLYSFVL